MNPRPRRSLLTAALCAALAGCVAPGAVDGGWEIDHPVSETLVACAALQRPVPTIAAVVEHLDGLPHPVSVACAIASFPRPLLLVATSSFVSAQPASGPKNPRVFILEPGLALSIAPGGPGQHLLELGQWITPRRTLKAELALPIEGPLSPSLPFTRVMFEAQMTSCALCHRNEQPSDTQDGGYVSTAYRPANDTVVGLEALRAQHQACLDDPAGGERCDDFHALFDFGEVRQGAFDPSVELFLP